MRHLKHKLYVPAILFSLILVIFSACESNRTIVNGLEEKDANEIMVFLAGKNIDATKVPVITTGGGGGAKIQLFDIQVSQSVATEAMALLNANGLPRRRGVNLLNIFQASGLVPSEMQDRIRYQVGLAEQIANTIRKIDGVLDADVQLSFPEEDPLNPQAPKGKVVASVYVKHSGVLDDPNSQLISKIKRLVASSVNGLDYDNVTVIGDKARFTDVSSAPEKAKAQEQKLEYVKVWTIIVAKGSLGHFQTIFLTFSVLLLLMTLVIVWLIWKLYPLMKKRGGMIKIFALSPLPDEMAKKAQEEKKEAPKEGQKPKEGGPTPPAAGTGSAPGVQENVESP